MSFVTAFLPFWYICSCMVFRNDYSKSALYTVGDFEKKNSDIHRGKERFYDYVLYMHHKIIKKGTYWTVLLIILTV